MKRYRLEKINKVTCDDLDLINGYKFSRKVTVTLYDEELIVAILTKKVDIALKKIIARFIGLDENDEDGGNQLLADIETLKRLLLRDYYKYIGKNKTKAYLLKLQEIESRVPNKTLKKTRAR